MKKTDDDYIKNLIFRRPVDAHKGNFGKILIYAGSPGMAGAAVLCARSALKSGAGLVQFLLPDFESVLLPILQISVPEATCVDYSSGIRLSSYNVIIAGSGLGTDDAGQAHLPPACPGGKRKTDPLSRHKILSFLLNHYSGTLVLDADALNMISMDTELAGLVRSCRAQIIITPHIGEARRLLHTDDPVRTEEARRKAAETLSEKYNCICVLKGAGTLVTENGESFRNTTGNPGMAAAGSGDSLAGLIGSLAAQGYPPLAAARAGVFIHGKAGDLAAQESGEMGMTSSDIVNHIPYALKLYY